MHQTSVDGSVLLIISLAGVLETGTVIIPSTTGIDTCPLSSTGIPMSLTLKASLSPRSQATRASSAFFPRSIRLIN